jgi:hypothetical protein
VLFAVSCASGTQCTAIDLAGNEVTFDPTAPTGAAPVKLPAANFPLAVACPSAFECVAVDSVGQGFVGLAAARPAMSLSAPATGSAGNAIAASAIKAALSGGSSPSGTITFKVFGPQASAPSSCTSGGTPLGSATVSGNGTYSPPAAFTPSAAGGYWWYASYSGDAHNRPAVSACGASMPTTLVGTTTATTLSASRNPAMSGEPVSFTATVTPAPPSGVVSFRARGMTIPACHAIAVNPSTGTATCTTSFLGGGSYPIRATYSGAPLFQGSQAPALTQIVLTAGQPGQTPTKVSLRSSARRALTGQRINYTATVKPVPDGGTIEFFANNKPINGCAALHLSNTGHASCHAAFGTVGARTIQAAYTGDNRFIGAISSKLPQRVRSSVSVRKRPRPTAGNAATLTLACAKASNGCQITGTLTTPPTAPSSQQLRVGQITLKIAPGHTKTITITLNATGRRLLARLRKLPVTLTITLTAAHQRTTIATTRLTL